VTLESIYYIGQTIAVVVIIATLFAVLKQSRQANKIARAELTRAQLSDASNVIASIYTSPELVDILLKVDGEKRLTARELFKFNYYMFAWWNNLEAGYNLSKDGLIDPLSYRQLMQTGSYLYRAKLSRAVWDQSKTVYPDGFVKELEAIFETESGKGPGFAKPKT
jgi:hypothetical protein